MIVLLEACALLQKRGCNFACNFIGQWSDITEQHFNFLCTKFDITPYVHAFGGMYGQEKAKYFSQADAFVHPTNNDCFPLVLLEAMQQSLPIISTREGGIPDIVDEKVGILINKFDSYALADVMQYLMRNPDVGIEMGRQGRMKYELEYVLPIFEHRLIGILDEIIN